MQRGLFVELVQVASHEEEEEEEEGTWLARAIESRSDKTISVSPSVRLAYVTVEGVKGKSSDKEREKKRENERG